MTGWHAVKISQSMDCSFTTTNCRGSCLVHESRSWNRQGNHDLSIFTQALCYVQYVTQGPFLSWVQLLWFPRFSFPKSDCHSKNQQPSLRYYLFFAGWRRIVTLQGVLAQRKMQTTSSGIWTRVAVSISNNKRFLGQVICLNPILDNKTSMRKTNHPLKWPANISDFKYFW